MKKKFLRANKGELRTKEFNGAIITQSWLYNKYLKKKSAGWKVAYGKQKNTEGISYVGPKRNIWVTLIWGQKTNDKFSKIVKRLFLNKISRKETINLVENDTIINDDQLVADIFTNYFNNIVKNLP